MEDQKHNNGADPFRSSDMTYEGVDNIGDQNEEGLRSEEGLDNATVPNAKGIGNTEDNNNMEETAAEIAAPVSIERDKGTEDEKAAAGTGVGVAALALSILSIFNVLPFLFAATGIVLGFVARAKGSTGIGSWAIGIGIVSLVMSMVIAPFF